MHRDELNRICPHCMGLLVKKFSGVDTAVLVYLAAAQTSFINGVTLNNLHERINKRADEREESKRRAEQAQIEQMGIDSGDGICADGNSPEPVIIRPSKDQIYAALNKMIALTFADYYKTGNAFHYYITKDGKQAIDLILELSNA